MKRRVQEAWYGFPDEHKNHTVTLSCVVKPDPNKMMW
jgi:hypothetical protein